MNYIGEHIGLIRSVENNDFTVPDYDVRLNHAIWGIVTEAGELMDLMKKHYVYNRTLNHDDLIDELGDLLFYTFQAIDEVVPVRPPFYPCRNKFEDKLESVIRRNMAKLLSRYPEGYSHNKANNRDVDAEKKAQDNVK